MATVTWTPSLVPSKGLEKKVSPKFLASEFGDGYSAIIPAGINNQLLEPLDLVFADIDYADAEVMYNFMRARNGETFLYTLPLEATPRKFRGYPYGITVNADGAHVFTVTLREQP